MGLGMSNPINPERQMLWPAWSREIEMKWIGMNEIEWNEDEWDLQTEWYYKMRRENWRKIDGSTPAAQTTYPIRSYEASFWSLGRYKFNCRTDF